MLDMEKLTLAMQIETILVPLPLPTDILYLPKTRDHQKHTSIPRVKRINCLDFNRSKIQ